MYYSTDVLEEIRIGNDIVDIVSSYVALKQKGNNYFGVCPFHNEKTPSFSVSADKQIFYCFGCGATGNVYSFIMQMENHNFVDAVKYLADRINYELPIENFSEEAKKNTELKSKLFEINNSAARFFYDNLISNEGSIPQKYLENRKIGLKVQRKYGLGYSKNKRDDLLSHLMSLGFELELILMSGLVIKSKENSYFDRFYGRLMFPIFDAMGRIIGFGGRSLDSREPKYLNSPDSILFDKSRSLYSINNARLSRIKEFILVEGYLDVISLYQANFKNVVASLGTAFNEHHAKFIKKYTSTVIILFDNDDAGIKATLRTIPILIKNGITVKVAQTKNAKDPDEFICKHGSEALLNILQSSQDHINFQIDLIKKKYDLSVVAEKVQFAKEVTDILKTVTNTIELDVHIKQIAKFTDISPDAIRSEVDKGNPSPLKNNEKYKQNLTYIQQNNLKEKGIQEARKKILKIFAESIDLRSILKNHLESHELIDETYMKLYKLFQQFSLKGTTIYAAEILNYFETVDEQKKVSEIFAIDLEFLEKSSLERAVNDLLKRIKRAYVDEKVRVETDVDELKKLIEIKRNIERLYITLSDG